MSVKGIIPVQLKWKKCDLYVSWKSTNDLREFDFHSVKGLCGLYKKEWIT